MQSGTRSLFFRALLAVAAVAMLIAIVALLCPRASAGDIHRAAAIGDADAVKALLAEQPDLIRATDADGRTPLHHAAAAGHSELAELLIAMGADLNAKDAAGKTPPDLAAGRCENLHQAAEDGDVFATRCFVALGADPDGLNAQGRTPLQRAAGAGHEGVVALLIAKGADVNAKGDRGWTALHATADHWTAPDDAGEAAAADKYQAIAALLLRHGADAAAKAEIGGTPLEIANLQGNTGIAELLVKQVEEARSLHELAKGDDIAKLKKLVEASPHLINTRCRGDTLLHRAIRYRKPEIVALLIEKGADLNAGDIRGWTPLHHAVLRKDPALAKLLIARGADVNRPNNKGWTPLKFASLLKREGIIKLLKDNGGEQ